MEEVFIVICNLCVPEFTIRSIELVCVCVCVRACVWALLFQPGLKNWVEKNYYNALLC